MLDGLIQNKMAILFDGDSKTIRKHINNALKEELESSKEGCGCSMNELISKEIIVKDSDL